MNRRGFLRGLLAATGSAALAVVMPKQASAPDQAPAPLCQLVGLPEYSAHESPEFGFREHTHTPILHACEHVHPIEVGRVSHWHCASRQPSDAELLAENVQNATNALNDAIDAMDRFLKQMDEAAVRAWGAKWPV